jgi:hypothetical protein
MRGALIGASVVLHLAVLLPLALSPPRASSVPSPPRLFVLPLEISPATSPVPVRPPRRALPPSRSPHPASTAGVPTSPTSSQPAADPAQPAVAGDWQVRPGDNPAAFHPRPRASACAARQWLTPEEQAACDTRFAERAASAPRIAGTGDADRDARFARQGARALAAYEERREVRASELPVCNKTGPVGDCGVEIQVDIFSTVDGWFPNQQRED